MQDTVKYEICHLCLKWDNAAVFLFLIVNDSVQYQFTCFSPCFVIVVSCLQMDMHYSTGLQYEQRTSRWLQEVCVCVCVCGLQSSCSKWADSRSVYLLRPVMHLVEDSAEGLF